MHDERIPIRLSHLLGQSGVGAIGRGSNGLVVVQDTRGRFAGEGGSTETRPIATLNGTLATTRWIVAILENHQRPDGSVEVRTGVTDQGGGAHTMIQRVVAQELGIAPDRVRVAQVDTARSLRDPGVGGSRVTAVHGNAALDGARKLKAARESGQAAPITVVGRAEQTAHEFATYAYGIEASVDRETGALRILDAVLVADVGQLWVLGEMKRAGELPADLVLKVSVALPVANPATARVLENLGATTLNLPVDLPLPAIAAIRSAVRLPIDVYVEGADDFGGTVRHYELPDIVRVAAPVYAKFTCRNAPNLYPAGKHLERLAIDTARERVRRAAIGLSMLERYYPEAISH